VPYFGVPKIELNLPASSAERVVKEPPCTLPCELLLGAKSPYAALIRLIIVGVAVVAVVVIGNAVVVVQMSTTNRWEPVLAFGPVHAVFMNVYDGAVLVPTLTTEAKNCGTVAIGLAIAGRTSDVLPAVAVALMFA